MNIEVMAEGLEFPEGPVACDDGSVLLVEVGGGRITRVTKDGRVQTVAETGGGPNGLAIGPDGAIYCCNNGGFDFSTVNAEAMTISPAKDYVGGTIQRVDISTGRVETLYSEYEGRTFGGPNDIAFAPDGSFWFSDYGKWTPDHIRHGGLYHATIDGSQLRQAAFAVSLNGVAVAADGSRVYAAATHERWILGFDPDPAAGVQLGALIADLPGRQGLDSMALEADGTIAIGCLNDQPGIARIDVTTGAFEKVPMPDKMPTNIAFGGPDMRTAYITFGERRALVKCTWPAPGLRLPFNL